MLCLLVIPITHESMREFSQTICDAARSGEKRFRLKKFSFGTLESDLSIDMIYQPELCHTNLLFLLSFFNHNPSSYHRSYGHKTICDTLTTFSDYNHVDIVN